MAAIQNLVGLIFPVAEPEGAELVLLVHLIGQAEGTGVDTDPGPSLNASLDISHCDDYTLLALQLGR